MIFLGRVYLGKYMFKIAIKRNSEIFYRHNYWLFSMYMFMIILTSIEKTMGMSYDEFFKGILQMEGMIIVPFVWITAILIPFLAIGPTVRMIIKEQYAHLHKIPIRKYALSVMVIVSMITCVFSLIPIVILHPVNNWIFVLSGLVYLILMVIIYSLLTVYIKPIYVFQLLCGLVIMCVMDNKFPILSQLMSVRFTFNLQHIMIDYVLLLSVILILLFNIHKIDFLTD